MREKLITAKENFIEKASLLLEYQLALAIGTPIEDLPLDYHAISSANTPKLLDELFPMLHEIQVTNKIEAETTKDVIALIKTGKVSLSEAMQLINIIKAADSESTLDTENKIVIEIAKGGAV